QGVEQVAVLSVYFLYAVEHDRDNAGDDADDQQLVEQSAGRRVGAKNDMAQTQAQGFRCSRLGHAGRSPWAKGFWLVGRMTIKLSELAAAAVDRLRVAIHHCHWTQ